MEITMNSPQTLNALSAEMAHTLLYQLQQWKNDANIELIIIRGAGGKAFCAGGDIQQIYKMLDTQDYQASDEFFSAEYQLDYALYRYSKPIIAFVDGIVMGGGMGIMQGCDYRIVTESIRMAMPETHIGLIPDVGSGDFLNQRKDKLEWLLPLTGGHINATDALYLGLADYHIAANQYQNFIQSLQQNNDIKDVIEQYSEKLDSSWIAENQQILATALQQSVSATLIALHCIQHEAAQKFCKRANYASPLATNITWKHLQSSRGKDRRYALQQEYKLVSMLCRHGEFKEGLRALIIDKDNSPNWASETGLWYNAEKNLNLEEV